MGNLGLLQPSRCGYIQLFYIITRFFFYQSSDEVWVVEIIEPISVLSQDNPETTSQILGLVSFVQNVKTDNPVTVVSR